MADSLFNSVYNPDVLSCLANLSNDEVFTPPEVVNQMLDMLPEELFRNPDTKFLDPACKTGVFLREIAKRLIKGLEWQIPDLQERIDHIFHNQLYGIAITELTSLLSRRGVYCSKYPQSEFAVTKFDTAEGNIRYKRINHIWKDGKCIYCSANKAKYERGEELETHAYEFIHIQKAEDLFKMKFDVIIGNPPYQMSDGGAGASAVPLYNKFVQQAKKLQPRYLSMIIPSRWFAGGRALDDFRDDMLNDGKISHLIDFSNSKECFPGVDIAGGVCYFLWQKEYNGLCAVTNISDGKEHTTNRQLNEFDKFIRNNIGLEIIHKILKQREAMLSQTMPNYNPFLIRSFEMGKTSPFPNSIKLHSSKGVSYIARNIIVKNRDLIDKYKVTISKVSSEHAGMPDKSGKYRILSNLRILPPQEVCSESYAMLAYFDKESEAKSFMNYISQKLPRFLILQTLTSINFTQSSFQFIPIQDFSKSWTDEELYSKYNLTQEEIDFIESMIKPMDLNGGDDNG